MAGGSDGQILAATAGVLVKRTKPSAGGIGRGSGGMAAAKVNGGRGAGGMVATKKGIGAG